jgi:hypothetical protein
MPLRPLDQPAIGRLNQVKSSLGVKALAEALVRWQFRRASEDPGSLVVPIAIDLPTPSKQSAGGGLPINHAVAFRERARVVRQQIATQLKVSEPALVDQITFTQAANRAWYLGPRPSLTLDSAIAAACSTSDVAKHYVRLVLLKELASKAALDADDVFIRAGFGPLVYLGAKAQKGSVLRMFEADFQVAEHSGVASITCLVHSKAFGHRGRTDEPVPGADPPLQTRFISIGEGMLEQVSRLNPRHFVELDARRRPPVGISLQADKMRHSRIYFLNIATEFAASVLRQADPACGFGVFQATHVVDEAYIPLDDLAELARPLEIVAPFGGNATLVSAVLERFTQWPTYLGRHTVGARKVSFQPPQVQAIDVGTDISALPVPSLLAPAIDRLFLNPVDPQTQVEDESEADTSGSSVKIWANATGSPSQAREVDPDVAYELLSQQKCRADLYTATKFSQVMDAEKVESVIQGIDVSLDAVSSLRPIEVANADAAPGVRKRLAAETEVRESIKRCLVELSLKECLVGFKPIPVRSLREYRGSLDASYTLIATRRIRSSTRKELVSAVDIEVRGEEIVVHRVRRTPWSRSSSAALRMCFEFPFIQGPSKDGGAAGPIRDAQFWMVHRESGERLAAWRGEFVPKLILNDVYSSIEAALRRQEDDHSSKVLPSADGDTGSLKYYSKGRDANLLPYYMSMRAGVSKGPEKPGTKVALQDNGAFVRVFVPPASSLKGAGSPLSGMRDVLVYASDGSAVGGGLLDHPMVITYLHTMTTGLLVGGENSKMSVLEKLARLALEN